MKYQFWYCFDYTLRKYFIYITLSQSGQIDDKIIDSPSWY